MPCGPTEVLLLVEDNPGDARLVRELLAPRGNGYTVEHVESLSAALARLGLGGIALVLADLGLPDSQGMATFAAIHERVPAVPVVMLTALEDEDLASRVLAAGAQDYLVKGTFDGRGLTRVIRYALERHRAEEEILTLNVALQQRVSELQRALDELDAFSYSVAHDLKEPLRAIDGFTAIVEESCGSQMNEEGKRILAVVRANAQRMGRLIEDLLALSRLSRQPMVSTTVETAALVTEVFEHRRSKEEERAIDLILGELPAVTGDPTLLRQLFDNLIANAVKFTGTRSAAAIEVGCSIDNEEAVFRVRDNGVGFDMAYVDKIFGPFERLHPRHEFPGTGVGLAIVKRVVERHSGRVWAEGALGEGATVFFTLPLAVRGESQPSARACAHSSMKQV